MLASSLALLVGCSGDESGGSKGVGPLVVGTSTGVFCIENFKSPGDMSHGPERIRNTSSKPVEVDEVKLVSPDGIGLIASYFREDSGVASGVFSKWPKVPLAQLKPLKEIPAKTSVNMVLHLRSKADVGQASFSGVELIYSQGAEKYEVRTALSVDWKSECS